MIAYLIDSDIFIDYLNGKNEAVQLLSHFISDESAASSIIVYAEVYEGLVRSARADAYLAAFNDVLAVISVLGLDMRIAEHFARLRSFLRRGGQMISDHDLWIAATALTHDLTVVSRDQHFSRIPDLKTYPLA